jgi:DNA polymerase-1
MQNQPKEMKKFMLADKGYLIGEIDKSQAENRIVAYIAPEPLMIEAFETGKDVHRLTAGLIFGKHSDEISDEPGSCSLGNGEQSERFWGKKANHGLNYDLGYKSFALYYEIPEREAKFIVERYHHAYPGIRRYHRWIQSELHNHGRLTNLLGRTRKFYGKRGDQRNKEAYSFIPQSTVPDELNSKGLVNIYHSPSYKPIELLNQVHDSIVFQIPVSIGFDNMAKMLKKLKWELETPLSWKGNEFSIPIDCKMGKVLGMANGVDLSESVDIVAERLEGIYNEH